MRKPANVICEQYMHRSPTILTVISLFTMSQTLMYDFLLKEDIARHSAFAIV